jgi:hypothetical protein
MRRFKLEAATRFSLILSGGSLILIDVYRDGDGFCLKSETAADHINRAAEIETGVFLVVMVLDFEQQLEI